MMGLDAFVIRGRGVALVEGQQFVQQRRAGTPVADDEDRRVGDRRVGHAAAEHHLLVHRQAGIDDRRNRAEQHDVPPAPVHVETVTDKQACPAGEITPHP